MFYQGSFLVSRENDAKALESQTQSYDIEIKKFIQLMDTNFDRLNVSLTKNWGRSVIVVL